MTAPKSIWRFEG